MRIERAGTRCSKISVLPLSVLVVLLASTAAASDSTAKAEKKWTLEELAPFVDGAKRGRSFAIGRAMYKQAKCHKCHRMDGEGNEFGPDLAQLDSKWTPLEILRHTLKPSAQINKQFQTQIFELDSGQVVTGLVTAIGRDSLKVIENPLVKSGPIRIKVSSIDRQRKSRISIMPAGLLDKLTREQILDLIAYVHARGNDRHSAFQSTNLETRL